MKHIEPDWNIDQFKQLNYTLASHNDPLVVNEYLWSGHNKYKMTIYKYHEPNPMPESMEYIRKHFSFWSDVCVAVNHFKPGQYLPMHKDLYGRYARMTGAYPAFIMRCMVMLEDSSPGQILQIRDECYGKWKAGDCFYWEHDAPHAFYNMSMVDRYAVQVTGVCNAYPM